VRDLILSGGLVYAALTYIPSLPNAYVRFAAWMAYGFAQGLVGTGIWILAHECGHGAFSLHPWFNDLMGFFLHTILMVPYFSWKFSHHRHHMFTGHMERDMVFVPATKTNYDNKIATVDSWVSKLGLDAEVLDDVPLLNLVKLIAHQTLGWPAYLLTNISAGRNSLQRPEDKRWWRLSHFQPGSVVFRPQEAMYVLLTDLGLLAVASSLYIAGQYVEGGWKTMCFLYLVPWFWVHHWLMAITYLHHTHEDVPHYDAENWTFVRGALATIDRDMGWIDRYLFHGIVGTHVVHHLFA
jgi:bifunctional Delta-12/omega-3 fatty acid desaturase